MKQTPQIEQSAAEMFAGIDRTVIAEDAAEREAVATAYQRKAAKQARRDEQQRESLDRAENGQSTMNYGTIYEEFAARGILDAEPRVNVFTYKAWQAKGRQVRKGEKSVKIVTYIPSNKRDGSGRRKVFPKAAHVFHVSQTDAKS